MILLDRVVFMSYLKAYAICLVSLLSLYVVIDLFTNLDDFAQGDGGLWAVLQQIGIYYGYKVTQIFDRLCEAIVLLAAMFTVTWMQRNNELLPLLSAGVSTQRVMRPVFLGALVFLTLGVANQELVIPAIADALMANRDDPIGEKHVEMQGIYDVNGVHIEGMLAYRKSQSVDYFYCTIPDNLASGLIHLTATKAQYIAPGDGPISGGWLLTGTTPSELAAEQRPAILDWIDTGKYFLRVRQADFEAATRPRQWYTFASTQHLYALLTRSDSPRMSPLAVQFHMRLTRPILGFLLVYLGLALILRDQNRNMFISAGQCLVMCAAFFGVIFSCKQLGDTDIISPALAAWLPVLLFGPPAITLYDAIQT